MFKGIVMEVKDSYIIVMKEDGTFEKIKSKGDQKIGETIIFLEEDILHSKGESNKSKKWLIPLVTIAAMFMLILSPFLNMLSIDGNAYAVLTIDINPSIEIYLDNNGKISRVTGENDEGVSLNLKELKGLTLDEGIAVLRTKLNDTNYIKDKSSVLVGFSFLKEDNISFETIVQDVVRKYFKDKNVAYLKGSKTDLEIAKEKNMTLGKYEALLKLSEDNFEDALENLTTQEILELLKNKDNSLFLSDDLLEEVEDELEDRNEDINEGGVNQEIPNNNSNNQYEDDDNDHDSENQDDIDNDHEDDDDIEDDDRDDDE